MGRIFKNKYGESCCVFDIVSAKEVKVVFENGYVATYQKNALQIGVFKTPYSRSVAGQGYLGEGIYTDKAVKYSENYKLWHNMISRCYNEKKIKKHPHYEGVEVCEEWKNFQNFSKWFFETKERLNLDDHGKNFVLDKDLLSRGKKLYSPDNCCFVPSEINSFLTGRDSCRGDLLKGVSLQSGRFKSSCQGVGFLGYFNTELEAFQAYKSAKESRAKDLAAKWKDFISFEAYQALLNYKVFVDD